MKRLLHYFLIHKYSLFVSAISDTDKQKALVHATLVYFLPQFFLTVVFRPSSKRSVRPSFFCSPTEPSPKRYL